MLQNVLCKLPPHGLGGMVWHQEGHGFTTVSKNGSGCRDRDLPPRRSFDAPCPRTWHDANFVDHRGGLCGRNGFESEAFLNS